MILYIVTQKYYILMNLLLMYTFPTKKNLLDGISIIKKYRFGIFLKLPMVNIFWLCHNKRLIFDEK